MTTPREQELLEASVREQQRRVAAERRMIVAELTCTALMQKIGEQQRMLAVYAARDTRIFFGPNRRHYKGGLYEAIAVVCDRTNGADDRAGVLYADADGILHWREHDEFNDEVEPGVRRFQVGHNGFDGWEVTGG